MANYSGSRKWLAVLVVLVFGVAALAATGAFASDSGSPTGRAAANSSGVAAAKKQLAGAYRGHYTHPPTTKNPPAKGKSVWVLSCGEQIPTCVALTSNMMAAGKLMGWKMHLYDGKGIPTNYSTGINDAIAAGANGILPVSYDCPTVKQALLKAQKAGVKSIPILGWDCDEVDPGQKGLYSAKMSLGKRFKSQTAEYIASGSDLAAWIVAQTNGKAETLELTSSEFLTLSIQQKGFEQTYKKDCPGCKIDTVSYEATDYGPKLQSEVSAALVRFPKVNALVGAPLPSLGPSQAIVQSGRKNSIHAIGGYGLAGDTNLIRQNQGLQAMFAQPMGWIAYAAVDELNRVFTKRPIVDEGFGYGILDKQHNLPRAGQGFNTNVNYVALYKKSWGR